MNHMMDSESNDFRDMVVMIKKSETTDLMDYTNSGRGGLVFKDTVYRCSVTVTVQGVTEMRDSVCVVTSSLGFLGWLSC